VQRVEVKLTNYKKDGTAFVNRLRVTPLTTSLGQYTHMLGILEEVPNMKQQAAAGAAAQLQRQPSSRQEQQQRELQHV
jgi:hypothetical protein